MLPVTAGADGVHNEKNEATVALLPIYFLDLMVTEAAGILHCSISLTSSSLSFFLHISSQRVQHYNNSTTTTTSPTSTSQKTKEKNRREHLPVWDQ